MFDNDVDVERGDVGERVTLSVRDRVDELSLDSVALDTDGDGDTVCVDSVVNDED